MRSATSYARQTLRFTLPDKCDQYCHEDMDYIWDVFDSYCGHSDGDRHKFCADLCYDGFYCGDSTCAPCEEVCLAEYDLVHEIFDYCADCDYRYDDDYDDDDNYSPTTMTNDYR